MQHGEYQGYRSFTPEDYINQKMSNLNLLWHNKKMNIIQYFSETKYKFKNLQQDFIFSMSYSVNQELDNLANNNHIYLNQLFKLAKILNNKKIF